MREGEVGRCLKVSSLCCTHLSRFEDDLSECKGAMGECCSGIQCLEKNITLQVEQCKGNTSCVCVAPIVPMRVVMH